MDDEALVSEPDSRLDEGARVERWRLLQLILAGYTVDDAELLAAKSWRDVDLHRAVDLVSAGCPAEIAAQILL